MSDSSMAATVSLACLLLLCVGCPPSNAMTDPSPAPGSVVQLPIPPPDEEPDRAVEIEVGDYLTCAAMRSGKVRCWGRRSMLVSRDEVPALAGTRGLAIARSSWATRVCGIRATGKVVCVVMSWSQIGKPFAEEPEVDGVVQLVPGGTQRDGICALREDGKVTCWAQAFGFTDEMAGYDGGEEVVGEHEITGVPPFVRLHRGRGVCGETEAGAFHCWRFVQEHATKSVRVEHRAEPGLAGASYVHGNLFLDAKGRVRVFDEGHVVDPPWDLPALTSVSTDRFTCGITKDKDVACASGREGYLNESSGVLGLGHRNETPADAWGKVDVAGEPTEVEVGSLHACALNAAGEVYCWGTNGSEQLGQPRRAATVTPTAIPLPGAAVQLASHFEVTCALIDGGHVYCWGYNAYRTPTLLQNRAKRISVTGGNTPLVCGHDDKRVWCDRGGRPHLTYAVADVVEVVAAWQNLCWRKATGQVTCVGERGVGKAASPFGPEAVPNVVATRLFLFGTVACAETTHGVACFTPSEDVSAPDTFAITKPPALQGFSAVSSSGSGLCGTKAGGVTCLESWMPGRIVERSRHEGYAPTALTSGPFHGCGLLAKKVSCWGNSGDGQLGHWGSRSEPTEMPLKFDVDEVVAGRSHTCVRSKGRVYCLGSNDRGQLAKPPTDDTFPSPVRVDLR